VVSTEKIEESHANQLGEFCILAWFALDVMAAMLETLTKEYINSYIVLERFFFSNMASMISMFYTVNLKGLIGNYQYADTTPH
jgi:hypothetical protein